MQSTELILNSNTQAIARLETHIDQLASAIGEGEEGEILSQPVVNPKDTQMNALQSGKQVDNQERTPSSQTFIPEPIPSPSDNSIQERPEEEEEVSDPSFEEIFGEELKIIGEARSGLLK